MTHSMPSSAHTVAVATPCWPAPGLGNDAMLAHPPREQPLAQGVVDLVGARVEQVFALEVDSGAAQVLSHALGKVKRRGPAGKILQQQVQFSLERSVGLGNFILVLEFQQRRHQRLRHIPAAIHAKASGARLGRN